MIKDKRGLSGVILTVIMIGLVLVAVGIVWVVVSGILTNQTESLEQSQKCVGLSFDVELLSCDGSACNVSIERISGSAQEEIDGVEMTFTNDEGASNSVSNTGNIVATKTIPEVDTGITSPTQVDVRVYFDVEGEDTPYYCSTAFSSE